MRTYQPAGTQEETVPSTRQGTGLQTLTPHVTPLEPHSIRRADSPLPRVLARTSHLPAVEASSSLLPQSCSAPHRGSVMTPVQARRVDQGCVCCGLLSGESYLHTPAEAPPPQRIPTTPHRWPACAGSHNREVERPRHRGPKVVVPESGSGYEPPSTSGPAAVMGLGPAPRIEHPAVSFPQCRLPSMPPPHAAPPHASAAPLPCTSAIQHVSAGFDSKTGAALEALIKKACAP